MFQPFSMIRRGGLVATFASVLALSLISAAIALAAASDLDVSFGTGGKVSQPIGWVYSHAYATAVQPDGKVIAAGETDNNFGYRIFAVARFNTDGALDTSFGGGGVVFAQFFAGNSDDVAKAVAIQPDGKILVAGESENVGARHFALARFNADGTPDTTFDFDGKAPVYMNGFATAMAVQSDGRIVLTGGANNGSNYDFGVVRYNPDGSPDMSFDDDGKLTTAIGSGYDYPHGVVIQPDGKIVVAGTVHNGSNYDFALIRYNANGSLDNSFDYNAIASTGIGSAADDVTDLALQPDGKLLVSGSTHNGSNNDFALTRFNTDGSLDASFDGDGRLTTTFGSGDDAANGVAIQADGRILLAGGASNGANDDFALARFNADGSLDASFDGDGKLLTPIGAGLDVGHDVALAANGRIVVVGRTFNSNYRFGLIGLIGDPPPVSPPAGPPAAPTATITSPATNKLKRTKLKAFKGTAGPAGQVANVEIAVRRVDKKLLKHGRCLWLKNNKAKFLKVKAKSKRCSMPRFLKATGTDSWSYGLKRKLAKGSYELYVRVTLTSGTAHSAFTSAQNNYKRFSLR